MNTPEDVKRALKNAGRGVFPCFAHYSRTGPTGTVFVAGGQSASGFSFAKPFGFVSIDAEDCTIAVNAGLVTLGELTYDTPQTSVAIAGGTLAQPTWGVFRFDFTLGTASILPATVSQRPVNVTGDNQVHQRPIFRAYVLNGKPVVHSWDWEGIIDLTGFFVR